MYNFEQAMCSWIGKPYNLFLNEIRSIEHALLSKLKWSSSEKFLAQLVFACYISKSHWEMITGLYWIHYLSYILNSSKILGLDKSNLTYF